jgi:hypothetical protein
MHVHVQDVNEELDLLSVFSALCGGTFTLWACFLRLLDHLSVPSRVTVISVVCSHSRLCSCSATWHKTWYKYTTEYLCSQRYSEALLQFDPVLFAEVRFWYHLINCSCRSCAELWFYFCSTWLQFNVLFKVLRLFSLEMSCAKLEIVESYFVCMSPVCVLSFSLLQTSVTVISVLWRSIRCSYSASWSTCNNPSNRIPVFLALLVCTVMSLFSSPLVLLECAFDLLSRVTVISVVCSHSSLRSYSAEESLD